MGKKKSLEFLATERNKLGAVTKVTFEPFFTGKVFA